MHPFSVLLARLALGSMWVSAGVAKLAQREADGHSVAAFGVLPRALADAVGRVLPAVELTLGLLLLAGLRTTAASGVSAALLLLFSLAIVINLARGHRVECHCFGQVSHAPISWWSVLRNTALVATAMIVVFGGSPYLAMDGWLGGSAVRPGDPPPIEFVPVLLMAAAGALIAALLVPAWQVAQAVATAKRGPALRMAERRFLRRVLGIDGRRPAQTATPGAEDRR